MSEITNDVYTHVSDNSDTLKVSMESNLEFDKILNFSDLKKRLTDLEAKCSDDVGNFIKENIELKQKNEKLQLELDKLREYVDKQIKSVKKLAKGLTGNRIFVLPDSFKPIDPLDGGDELTEVLGVTNEFDLDTLAGLEGSILTKFKLRDKMMFFRNGIEIVFVKDAIDIIRSYGYEIVYEYDNKVIDLDGVAVEYK